MANTSTTTPGMQQAAGLMLNTQSVAKNGLQTVEGSLSTLMTSWRGEASTAFSKPMNDWVDDCSYIIGRLGDMIQLLDSNRQVITSGEANNAAVAAHIPVGPGLDI